jgi:hypothetical protein
MQRFRPDEGEIGLPVLKIKELRQGTCDSSSEFCSPSIRSDYIVHDGDVVFSWSGSLLVDFWCGGDCGLNQHLFKITSTKFLAARYKASANPAHGQRVNLLPKVIQRVGAAVSILALLPLPLLAATNQLIVPNSDLPANWPHDGYVENVLASNGDIYSGEFRQGKYHGQGILRYANGSTYEGVFVAGMRDGQGRHDDAQGWSYSGQWAADQMEGEGSYLLRMGRYTMAGFLRT